MSKRRDPLKDMDIEGQVKELEARQKLALRMIEIGFTALAKELHPDKGGSEDAMMCLSRARNRLKLGVFR
jgi:hypothetical protein